VFAGVADGVDHPLNAALAEAARDEDAVVAAQTGRGCFGGIDFFGLDPLKNGLVVMRQAAVQQGFAEAFVGVLKLHYFPTTAMRTSPAG